MHAKVADTFVIVAHPAVVIDGVIVLGLVVQNHEGIAI